MPNREVNAMIWSTLLLLGMSALRPAGPEVSESSTNVCLESKVASCAEYELLIPELIELAQFQAKE